MARIPPIDQTIGVLGTRLNVRMAQSHLLQRQRQVDHLLALCVQQKWDAAKCLEQAVTCLLRNQPDYQMAHNWQEAARALLERGFESDWRTRLADDILTDQTFSGQLHDELSTRFGDVADEDVAPLVSAAAELVRHGPGGDDG